MQDRFMADQFGRKLQVYGPMPDADVADLAALAADAVCVGPDCDMVREGDPCDSVLAVLRGFACRYRLLPGGQRQITAYLIPGDLFGLQDGAMRAATSTIGTLTPCAVAQIPRDAFLDLARRRPAIDRALRLATVTDEAILQEWLVNVGRRTAYQRIGHLLCELLVRMRAIGAAQGHSYDLPLTQYDIGDTTALSVVHVNRTLQQLRGEGLIRWDRRRVDIPNPERLAAASMFDPAYLGLGEAPADSFGDDRLIA
ncbi:Crp/Fnr family transcriptional regulator [Lichenibacterium ramalinae]|uniref:Crp/Fnr family transcriptional regulator n=2 Tax=Lichenibacterium ramalinae TaxID=2316527 RepID=A0A4Q2RH44_9HYPH|nr:Crp/Fnr family transcriptional regulator [Lichenibacterium ramalinae]